MTLTEADYRGRISVNHIGLNSGGYNRDGVYFGTGQRLYCLSDEDGLWVRNIRAGDRPEALSIARDFFPLAKIRQR